MKSIHRGGFFEYYNLDVDNILEIIKERTASKVLIQIPEGFKRHAYELVDRLSSRTGSGVEIHIDASPGFGSCLLDLRVVEGYDLVVHIGHEQYPYWPPPKNVVFIDLQSKTRLSSDVTESLFTELRNLHARRLAIYATAQHKDLGDELIESARTRGFDVLNKGQIVVFGCWFSDLDAIKNSVDAVMVIAGGRFHALGVGLRLGGGKEVVAVDPYMNTYKLLKEDIIKVLKIRLGKVVSSLDAFSWLLITGSAGQYRLGLIRELSRLITSSGGKYYVATAPYLTRDLLTNLDSDYIDSIVVTSCPRLAIEDLHDYFKPVLTPGEAFMSLRKRLDPYVFPW
ncbi:MAG: diphthamide biosynthesis enzyme Dph2 [Zestosphaera sp.]